MESVSLRRRKICMDSQILHILIPLDQGHMRPKHTSLTPQKNREKKFIYALILMSKYNYMSSIIIISCFKYLLTLFMDDIHIIDNYLSYQWLIRLLCGFVPYTRRYPQILRISLIRKYTINLTLYVTNQPSTNKVFCINQFMTWI